MRRRKREEQEFLESVDRLLAGEEVNLDEGADEGLIKGADEGLIKGIDEGLRSAVEFSRRLSDLYPGPTPEFRERLKSRLLMKLTEQEVAAGQRAGTSRFWDFLDRLVPRSPVWRTAAVTMIMVVAVVTVVWRTGMLSLAPAEEAERAKGVLTAESVAGEEEGMTVAGRVVESEAPAPQVVMEEEAEEAALAGPITRRVIRPDLTETVGDISVTLEEVETLGAGVVFTAFVTPPDYVPPGEDDVKTVRRDDSAPAEYTVGDTTIRLEYAEATNLQNGIRMVWGRDETGLSAVPAGTIEIIIRILSLDGREGPWVFHISLQD